MIKKSIIILLLIVISTLNLWAPDNTRELIIEENLGIESYTPLIRAVYIYESGRDSLTYNPKENAVGGLQIRQCRVDHYNSLLGTNYKLKDFYSLKLSIEVFLYFTNHDASGREISNKSYQQAAKNWNGSGPMTDIYWNNIKKLL